eukprot:1539794-Amphidinium_carterae.1
MVESWTHPTHLPAATETFSKGDMHNVSLAQGYTGLSRYARPYGRCRAILGLGKFLSVGFIRLLFKFLTKVQSAYVEAKEQT